MWYVCLQHQNSQWPNAYVLKSRTQRTDQSLDYRLTRQQKSEYGNSVDTPLSNPAKRTSKRFPYEGRRKCGDSLKAFPDTQQNGPTFFQTIAPASQIVLVMHDVFHMEKKSHNRAQVWCIELNQCWGGFSCKGWKNKCRIIFHNKIKSLQKLQLLAKTQKLLTGRKL